MQTETMEIFRALIEDRLGEEDYLRLLIRRTKEHQAEVRAKEKAQVAMPAPNLSRMERSGCG
jgi:hypothetical protein